jgi:hypothetical protein
LLCEKCSSLFHHILTNPDDDLENEIKLFIGYMAKYHILHGLDNRNIDCRLESYHCVPRERERETDRETERERKNKSENKRGRKRQEAHRPLVSPFTWSLILQAQGLSFMTSFNLTT